MRKRLFIFFCIFKTAICFGKITDPLPSWNEGPAKQAIIQFVQDTTTPGSPDCVKLENRIAVFDQDGTLWVEQPIYTQFFFAIDAIRELAAKDPGVKAQWKGQEPYQAIIDGDLEKLKNFTLQDIEKILAVSHANLSVEEFKAHVQSWISTATHPRFKRPFTELIYQPMVEVIKHLKSNGYKVYIVSGGGQEFIRVYSEKVYGIPTEQIIGTAGKVKYQYDNGKPDLWKLPEVLFVDDKSGKPEAINLIIGKRPVAAFGNSDGDREMLEWSQGSSQGSSGKSLQLLVHHDDPVREYAYDTDSKIGTFSKSLFTQAADKKWIVVSMKNDWKVIFPHENPQ